MDNIEENVDNNSRVYEVGYLLLPNISEVEVPGVYSNLKELITSLGGELVSDEMPRMMTLAYSMSKVIQNIRNKFDSAYFGWVKFEMNPEKVLEIKKKLDLDPNFLRFLILKTVKENTIAARRFVHRDSRKKMSSPKTEGENETALPIDKEEIDKEIDAMVAN
jgi:ribosomal protein S6